MQAISIVLNGIIAVLAPVAWLQLAMGVGDPKQLATRGLGSLKYFTVLSNLFSGVVSLVYVVLCLRSDGLIPLWLTVFKLKAASAVMLTFITVVVLLGPFYGYDKMYKGGNLWLHLVLPLLALVDCCFFVPVYLVPFWMTLFAMLPTLLYGAWYLARVILHGAREDDREHDFYGFLRWGKDKIAIVTVGMLGFSWVIALLIRLGSRLFGLG